MYVSNAGSAGRTDASNAAPSLPPAGLILLQTLAAAPRRNYVEVQNQSAGQLVVALDDGLGNLTSVVLLASGGGANVQGAGWSSIWFKGRVRVYGAAAAQLAMFEH